MGNICKVETIIMYIFIYALKWKGSQGDLFFKLFIFLQLVFRVFYTFFRKFACLLTGINFWFT